MDKSGHSKKEMLNALTLSLGVVTTACDKCGVPRSTHYKWMQEDEEYRAAVEELADVALDFAESKLHKQMDKGDTTATIFYLKTKGKKRGYVERQEITGPEGGPMKVIEIRPVD